MGRDECEECRRDQEAADDANDHGDVGAGGDRRQCASDGGSGRRRDHAIGLPSRKVSFEALPVKPVKHISDSPAHVHRARTHAIFGRAPSRSDWSRTMHGRFIRQAIHVIVLVVSKSIRFLDMQKIGTQLALRATGAGELLP
jgi:hypothetical protein